MWTHCFPSAQVESALSLLGEGPRMTLQNEYDFDVDSSTILQAQAHLSQNYENLQALAKVMFFVQETSIAKHVAYVFIHSCFQGRKIA